MSSAAADYEIACAFETGTDNIPQSIRLSINYLKSAADKGHPVAQHKLSRIYRRGRGTKPDPVEAERYARLAAAQNYLPAVGICYDYGYGVHENESLADERYLAAHDAGDLIGTWNLAVSYAYNQPDRPADFCKAFELANYGATYDDGDCVLLLADSFEDGRGVNVDQSRAMELYHRAAKLGVVDAYTRIADIYSDDDDDRWHADKIVAFQWYLRAAQQDCRYSQYIVAHAYRFGNADPPAVIDVEESVRWLRRAAANGSLAGMRMTGWFYEFGTAVVDDDDHRVVVDRQFAVQKDLRKAVECYRASLNVDDDDDDDPEQLTSERAAASLKRLSGEPD